MTTQTPGQLINEMAPGEFLKLAKIIPAGSLEARKLSTGAVNFYWRVTVGGKNLRELVGIYDSGASPKSLTPTAKGFSIMAATRAAESMAQKHVAHLPDGGIVGVKKAEEAAKVANAIGHGLSVLEAQPKDPKAIAELESMVDALMKSM